MQGIFKTFHLQTYKRIELGKVYTTFAKVKPKDITQLSFRRKGIIGSSNFIIQSIEYNPKSNSPAKTVLLYDEKPNVNDLTKVSNTITLAGSTPQSGTVTGSGSGLVGANGATVNIQLSYTPFINSMTNVLILSPNSGITQVSNTNANVLVFQNGQKLIPTIQYIISGSTVGINVNTHYSYIHTLASYSPINKQVWQGSVSNCQAPQLLHLLTLLSLGASFCSAIFLTPTQPQSMH